MQRFLYTLLVPALCLLTRLAFAETLNFGPLDGRSYDFDREGTAGIEVFGVPDDGDWDRIGMAADTVNGTYSLFMMKQTSGSQLYLFQFENGTYRRQPVAVTLQNRPTNLDTGSFAMVANSTRLFYIGHNRGTPDTLYLAPGGTAANGSYDFDFDAVGAETIEMKNAPSDLDWSSWSASMDSNGKTTLLVGKMGTKNTLYRATIDAFDRDEFDFESETITVKNRPFGSSDSGFMSATDSRGVNVLIYKSQGVNDAFPDAVDLDDDSGWMWSPWFDIFNGENFPWIYRDGAGWYYVVGDKNDAIYLFSDASNQWLWTSPDTFPAAVDLTTGDWQNLD